MTQDFRIRSEKKSHAGLVNEELDVVISFAGMFCRQVRHLCHSFWIFDNQSISLPLGGMNILPALAGSQLIVIGNRVKEL